MKTSYTIENISIERFELLQAINKFKFTGKMIVFNDGSSYPIINGKYTKYTPYQFARNTKNGYICALYERFILCKDGKVIDYDYEDK